MNMAILVSPEAARIWSVPRIVTSGIHRLPVTLHMLGVKSDKSDWLRVQNKFSVHAQKNWTQPVVMILGADQNKRGLWRQECKYDQGPVSQKAPKSHF